jgi:hypothetical protein
MVINDKEKFIFIHIPKNAGNSITRLLLKHRDNYAYGDVPQHAALKWVGNNYPEKLLYKKICFTRNPFSRMVSWWTYYRSNEKFWKDYDLARHARDMEFNEWLLKCIQRGRQELVLQVYFISPNFKYKITNRDSTIDIHPLRYNNFIREKFGLGETDNPTPIYQPIADFVGKVENLEQDMRRLFNYLGVTDTVMDVTQENKSKEKVDYREQYNTESVEIVQSIYRQDFEYFNYSYDLTPRVHKNN